MKFIVTLTLFAKFLKDSHKDFYKNVARDYLCKPHLSYYGYKIIIFCDSLSAWKSNNKFWQLIIWYPFFS